MALIKTLDELANWAGYRRFMQSELKSLGTNEPFFISRDDFDFDINGRPWTGRVVLFGRKGESSMKVLTRLGIQFRSGTCRADGARLMVDGLSSGLLKAGNKTFDRMSLGCSAEVGEAAAPAPERQAPDPVDRGSRGETAQEQERVPPPAAMAEVRSIKGRLRTSLPKALADKPANAAQLTRLAKAAAAQEQAGRWPDALATLQQLERALASAAPVERAEADAAAKIAARKKAMAPRIKAALAEQPGLRTDLGELLERADKRVHAGKFAAADSVYDQLEDLLEHQDEDTNDDLDTLTDWTRYCAFLRSGAKRLSEDPLQPQSGYISRKPVTFQVDGQPWQGRAFLVGPKAAKAAKALKREGVLFAEVSCHRVQREILVPHLPAVVRTAINNTLKATRCGFRVAAAEADEAARIAAPSDSGAQGEQHQKQFERMLSEMEPRLRRALAEGRGDTSGMRAAHAYSQEIAAAGDWPRALASLERLGAKLTEAEAGGAGSRNDTIPPGLVAYRRSLVAFAQTKDRARQQLATLARGVAALPDEADLAVNLARTLSAIFDRLADVIDRAIGATKDEHEPVTAAVRAELDDAIREVGSNQLLQHVEGSPFGVTIREPLLRALVDIRSAMPA